ncbi:MAG: CcmD family protein [Solirubrobacteraceae bacterium]
MPLHEAVKYVAAAYIAVFVIVLLYVAIMARRLRKVERSIGELTQQGAGRDSVGDPGER